MLFSLPARAEVSPPQIVPLPTQQTALEGESFTLGSAAKLVAAGDAVPVAEKLASILRPSTGYALPISQGTAGPGDISLALTGAAGLGAEGYTLEVDSEGVEIEAAQPAGLFYGAQSLRQLLPAWVESNTVRPGPWEIHGVSVTDKPRYEHRGIMHDIARHFQTPEGVKRLIDNASAYKINRLHLHLADDQGFRIAIGGRPELTQIGGQFAINNDPGGYWTQDAYKDVVAYAAQHHMAVIPEIDTPGHTNAIIMSYNTPGSGFPLFEDINCSNRKPASWLLTGAVGYSALCVNSPNTWAIVQDIVTQLSAMSTTSSYYHMGGDEVPTSIMSAPDFNAFVNREADIVRAQDKIPLGWHEIAAANFSPDRPGAIQYWGNGNPTGTAGDPARRAVLKGMKVVMSPANRVYLDMKQFSGSPLGLTWACSVCDVTQTYNWGTTAPTGDAATYIPARTVSTTAVVPPAAGATRVHVASVAGLEPGQPLTINTSGGPETVTIGTVGTAQAGATSLSAPAEAGATNIKVGNVNGYAVGQLALIGTGANLETAEVTAVGTTGAAGTGVTLATPLTRSHTQGTSTRGAGTGVTFTPALANAHATGVAVTSSLPAVTDEHIIGIEGAMWSETLVTIADVEFMAFPRLPVVAELGWSPKTHENRTLASYQQRIASHGARWQLRDQNFYPSTQVPWQTQISATDRRLSQGTLEGSLATISAPGATPAQLTATIDWGDGTSEPVTPTGTAATNKTANSLYDVSAGHTYPRPGGYTAKLSVTRGTTTTTETFNVVVDAIADGSAGGTVPATLSLTLGTPASFGAFVPGVARDYTATQAANVISTAGDAALSVADPSPTNTGHLVNGAFALPQPLQAAAGESFAAVGGSANPLTVKTYTGPVSNDPATVTFKQSIGASDALRTGAYSKTLVFTLSTTTP